MDIKSTLLKSSDEILFSINYRYSFSLNTYQVYICICNRTSLNLTLRTYALMYEVDVIKTTNLKQLKEDTC